MEFMNIQAGLGRIEALLTSANVAKRPLAQTESQEILTLFARMAISVKGALETYGFRWHPDQVEQLYSIIALFERAPRTQDPRVLAEYIEKVHEAYDSFCKYAPVYLARHPEKANPGRITNEKVDRELSAEGVAQARNFALLLGAESLLTDRDVKVVIKHSSYKRTKLFGQIIERELALLARETSKKIAVSLDSDHLIDGKLISGSPDISIWVDGTNAPEVAKKTTQWFERQVEKSPSGKYLITIGITHHPNIAGFLIYALHRPREEAVRYQVARAIRLLKGRYL